MGLEFKDRFVGGLRRDAAREALVRSGIVTAIIVALIVAGVLTWSDIYEHRPARATMALFIAPILLWFVATQLATALGLAHALIRNEPPLRIRDGRLIYLNTWVLDVPLTAIKDVRYANNGSYYAPRGLSFDVKGRFFPAWIPSDPIDATVDDVREMLGLSA